MKTKLVGYLILVVSLLKIAIDALNGGDFDVMGHFDEVAAALGGLGLVFLRGGVTKEAAKAQALK